MGLQWNRWLPAFKVFADCKLKVQSWMRKMERRCALLLHLVGTNVQAISTLLNTRDVKDYKKEFTALNEYSVSKVDTMYSRHCFSQLTQASEEKQSEEGKQSDSLWPDLDGHWKIVTTAKTQTIKSVAKSFASAPARASSKNSWKKVLAKVLKIVENREKVDKHTACCIGFRGKRKCFSYCKSCRGNKTRLWRKLSHLVPKTAPVG